MMEPVFHNNLTSIQYLQIFLIPLTFVPTPIKPPGTAYIRSFCSANNDTILERMGLQVSLPSESLETRPGLTSISCPTLSTPINYIRKSVSD